MTPSQTPTRTVPSLDLRRQYARIRPQVVSAIERVCDSQQYVLGPEVTAFEREASAFLGCSHAIGCASGTDALWLALAALEIGPGDAVITTPFTFFATASAIVRTGARPIICDVDPQTLNLDPDQVKKALRENKNVKAIMPVHLYGQCADVDAFDRLAQEHGVAIVEDAAQAFGAAWNGRRAGAVGHIAAFSFYPTKNLSCYGDGGLVTTNDERLAERTRMLRVHGSRQRYYHDEIGWNSRLDSIQASVLRVKLEHIERWNEERRQKAALYDGLLHHADIVGDGSAALSGQAPVQLPTIRNQAYHIFHQYVIRAYRRDELKKYLTERGIGCEVYYPVPLHMQKCFAFLGYTEGAFLESERAAKEVLALPIFPELEDEEQRYVVEQIAGFYS